MARYQRLNEAQIADLFDPPTEQRELVRHYTLSDTDLTAIKRCRGDHNRLGHALMRCYLQYPGRAMRIGERPAAALLAFVAEQIDVLPESIDTYIAEERNRQRHAIECQEQLGLRPFGKRPAAELTGVLLPQAIENDRLAHLAELVMRNCRERRIVAPSPAALERLTASARSATEPMRTSSTVLPASIWSSPRSSYGTPDISSARWPSSARVRTFRITCWGTSPRSAGSMST